MSKMWKVPVTWEMYGVVEVEADTLEEAVELAVEVEPLPDDAEYIDGSCKVDPEHSITDNNKRLSENMGRNPKYIAIAMYSQFENGESVYTNPWYRDHRGKIFEVLGISAEYDDHYIVNYYGSDGSGKAHLVYMGHCDVVEEYDKSPTYIQVSEKMQIDTKGQRITVQPNPNPSYPGVWVKVGDKPLVLVEYDEMEEKNVIRVWSSEADTDDEEYEYKQIVK